MEGRKADDVAEEEEEEAVELEVEVDEEEAEKEEKAVEEEEWAVGRKQRGIRKLTPQTRRWKKMRNTVERR